MNVGDRTIKFHHITSGEWSHWIKFPKFTSCTVRRSSNKMQRSLLATSDQLWEVVSAFPLILYTCMLGFPSSPYLSRCPSTPPNVFQKALVLFHLQTKNIRWSWSSSTSVMTPWHSVPPFWSFFVSPSLPEQKRLLSPKKRAIFYIILHIYIYCIFGSSNQLGLVVGSQLGLFVVSSLGAKHGAFHSEDETQKVGSSGGQGVPKRAREIRRHKKILRQHS